MDRAPRASYTLRHEPRHPAVHLLKGRRFGTDAFGNVYYEERRPRAGYRVRRWVVYAGAPEASLVPPEWHAWLHYTTDEPLVERNRRPWEKPHCRTRPARRPVIGRPGHDYRGGTRARATGDYEAWTPGS